MRLTLHIEVDAATLRAFSQTHGYAGLATRPQVKTALQGLIDAYWNDVNDDAERGREAVTRYAEEEQRRCKP